MRKSLMFICLLITLARVCCVIPTHRVDAFYNKDIQFLNTLPPLEKAEKKIDYKIKKAFPQPLLAIIIDDFGGYDRAGVDEMLQIKSPLTVAVMPFGENTVNDSVKAQKNGYEVILHMPMESHIALPNSWYGKVYINNYDSKKVAKMKLDACLKQLPMAKGVNIHIGSGVCQNEELLSDIIGYLKEKGLYFCDSRTHLNTKGERAFAKNNLVYLGRDVFLEPHGQNGYLNACRFLLEAGKKAKERGYAVAIGHVGSEGGKSTAKAIIDVIPEIEKMGVKIVFLSKINEALQSINAI